MKKITHKINTYLLENHPLLWNTKVVWMLGISAIIHIIFFLLGLVCFTNPTTLHSTNATNIFYKNGMMFFSVMISVVLLVAWLIFMFKNNAFKNFYPTKKEDIFKQFIIFFIIIFCSTNFYYAYMAGVKTYIANTYQDKEVAQDIALANKTAPFFSHEIRNYTLNNVIYPEPLNDFYCLVNKRSIKYHERFYTFLNNEYQFYNLKIEKRDNTELYNESKERNNSVYNNTQNGVTTYYKINEVEEVDSCIKTVEPSYYNYSKEFYSFKTVRNNYTYYNNISGEKFTNEKALLKLAKAQYELLERNNPDEITSLLSHFLSVSKKYNIKHNLDTETWFSLIYHPNKFLLKHLIAKNDAFINNNRLDNEDDLKPIELLALKFKTNYFLESDSLYNTFENINEIKEYSLISEEINFFIWLSFTLSLLILIFRVTGIKPLIFSVITTGLLIISIILFHEIIRYLGISRDTTNISMSYFTLIISSVIIYMVLFKRLIINKQITAIFINITLAGFVPYIILICITIRMLQVDACTITDNSYSKKDCYNLLETFNFQTWSIIFLVIGFVFTYLFSKRLLNWKALPES